MQTLMWGQPPSAVLRAKLASFRQRGTSHNF